MVSFAIDRRFERALQLGPVRLSNDLTLHVAQQGPRQGPAVIFLHGTSDSWFSFSRVLPLLPSDLRVVVPDHRGHGDSDCPAAGYRPTDFADDTVRLMDALGIEKAVVVGHSMGSFIARKILERAPQRVARLVLLGAGHTADIPTIRELQVIAAGLTDPVDEAFVREFQASCIETPVPREFMETVVAVSRRVPARVWQASLAGLTDDPVTIKSPITRTLVIGGRQDAVFSVTDQMVLARQFPRGELQLVDDVGHSLHWERPETFVNALMRFGV